MLYRFGRPIARFLMQQFFSEIRLVGAAPQENGPLLIVANHPNFMLDSFVVVTIYDRPLWFIAKSTLFGKGLQRWLLTKLHLVPIYRRMDNPGDMSKNDEVFRRVVEELGRDRAVTIFPEGVSLGERRLSAVKTGAARMALLAEEAAQFELNLVVQPVGITYTDLQKFRSSVTVVLGQPISVMPYKEQYAQDSVQAVKSLTEEIAGRLNDITVVVENEEDEMLVERISKLYATAGYDDNAHARMKLVVRNVEALAPSVEGLREGFEARIDELLTRLNRLRLDSRESLEVRYNPLLILMALPFVVLGFCLLTGPYRLIGPVAEQLSGHRVSLASNKLITGVAVFGVWYLLIAALAFLLLRWEIALGLLVLALGSGYCVNKLLHPVQLFLMRYVWPGGRKTLQSIISERDTIVADLEALRVE